MELLGGRPEGGPARHEGANAMRSFLHQQNLSRYMDLLETTADPEVRERLRERLVEAEDRFGACRERLETADVFIARLKTRLREQEDRIAALATDGADTALAEQLRQTVTETLRLFEAYRGALDQSLEHYQP